MQREKTEEEEYEQYCNEIMQKYYERYMESVLDKQLRDEHDYDQWAEEQYGGR